MNVTSLVLCASAAMLVRMGMAIAQVGSVRARNSSSAVLRNIADAAVAVLAFWLIGHAIAGAAGGNAIIALDRGLVSLVPSPHHAPLALLMLGGVLLATGVVTGAAAERSRFWPMVLVSAVIGGLIVPIAAHWVWGESGWLRTMGFRDAAGASVFHLVGAKCAGVVAWVVGARAGKFNRDGSICIFPGHNIPLAGLGTLLMWLAWPLYLMAFVENRPDGLALAAINALLGGAAGALAAMLVCHVRFSKPDFGLTCAGLIGALVAVSAVADRVGTRTAILIGGVAGVLVPLCSYWIERRMRIDDPTGAVAAHGIGATVGLLAAGWFAPGLAVAGRLRAVGVQFLGIVAIGAMAAAVCLLVMFALRAFAEVRSTEADEYDGLDLAEHDVGAYPDFQQNTIRSYHLREI